MPLCEAQVMDLIRWIENSSDPYFDRVVLSTAVKLAYWRGLKKGEIISLKIISVLDSKGGVDRLISVYDKKSRWIIKLSLPDHVRVFLEDYIAYLKANRFSLARTAPLFPQKNKSAYTARKIGDHLKKFSRPGVPAKFEMIRQAGMRRLKRELEAQGITNHDNIVRRIAEYARTTPEDIERVIFGQ